MGCDLLWGWLRRVGQVGEPGLLTLPPSLTHCVTVADAFAPVRQSVLPIPAHCLLKRANPSPHPKRVVCNISAWGQSSPPIPTKLPLPLPPPLRLLKMPLPPYCLPPTPSSPQASDLPPPHHDGLLGWEWTPSQGQAHPQPSPIEGGRLGLPMPITSDDRPLALCQLWAHGMWWGGVWDCEPSGLCQHHFPVCHARHRSSPIPSSRSQRAAPPLLAGCPMSCGPWKMRCRPGAGQRPGTRGGRLTPPPVWPMVQQAVPGQAMWTMTAPVMAVMVMGMACPMGRVGQGP